MADIWRFGPVGEADFEPLLALRIDVMREHLERVFRYKPSRARRGGPVDRFYERHGFVSSPRTTSRQSTSGRGARRKVPIY
jgi:hypothetical protein